MKFQECQPEETSHALQTPPSPATTPKSPGICLVQMVDSSSECSFLGRKVLPSSFCFWCQIFFEFLYSGERSKNIILHLAIVSSFLPPPHSTTSLCLACLNLAQSVESLFLCSEVRRRAWQQAFFHPSHQRVRATTVSWLCLETHRQFLWNTLGTPILFTLQHPEEKSLPPPHPRQSHMNN